MLIIHTDISFLRKNNLIVEVKDIAKKWRLWK